MELAAAPLRRAASPRRFAARFAAPRRRALSYPARMVYDGSVKAASRLAATFFLGALAACGRAPTASPTPPSPTPSLAAGEPAQPAEPAEPAEPDAVLWVGGDVLLSDAMVDFAHFDPDPAQGFARMLEPVARVWREPGAFVLVNLEMPVARTQRHEIHEEASNPHGLTKVHLSGPAWLPEGLARAGVAGVTLANNHALDQDRDGLLETVRAARRAGLVVTGAGVYPEHRWPITLGPPGREICVMNFYDSRGPGAHEPGEVARSVLDDEAFALVRAARSHGAAVVAVVHVLGELLDRPEPAWRSWAERLIDAGVSAIVVHGTHVVMPVERIRGVPVVWGLGNLVSDMGRMARPGDVLDATTSKLRSAAARESLLLRLTLTPDGAVDLRLLAAWMSQDRVARWRYPLPGGDVVHFALRPLSRCSPALALPDWPAPYRHATERWLADRRDHLLAVTELSMDPCDPGQIAWLHLPGVEAARPVQARPPRAP